MHLVKTPSAARKHQARRENTKRGGKLLELDDSVPPTQLQKQVTRYICKARTFITSTQCHD
jgi:hypothetical protein